MKPNKIKTYTVKRRSVFRIELRELVPVDGFILLRWSDLRVEKLLQVRHVVHPVKGASSGIGDAGSEDRRNLEKKFKKINFTIKIKDNIINFNLKKIAEI